MQAVDQVRALWTKEIKERFWLIHKDERCAVIVPHVILEEEERQGCGEMAIPARSILRIVALRPAATRPCGRRVDLDEARMKAMIK